MLVENNIHWMQKLHILMEKINTSVKSVHFSKTFAHSMENSLFCENKCKVCCVLRVFCVEKNCAKNLACGEKWQILGMCTWPSDNLWPSEIWPFVALTELNHLNQSNQIFQISQTQLIEQWYFYILFLSQISGVFQISQTKSDKSAKPNWLRAWFSKCNQSLIMFSGILIAIISIC